MAKKKTETLSEPKQPVIKPLLRLLATNFFEHDVGKNAAALAYYLLFALFPLLIFVSNLFGLMNLNITVTIQVLQRFLPNDIVGLVETYLDHVSHTSSHTLLWFALVFSIWFPMRVAKGLMEDVRLAYQLGKPQRPVAYTIRQLIYTIVFLIVIALTLFLATMGKHVLVYIKELLPQDVLQISDYLLGIWQYVRFFPIALLMFVGLGTLYAVSLDKKPPMKTILPGISAALISWLAVSIGFSIYVENFANYSAIYGTLGAVIILLLWLYMTAVIMILGAEINAALFVLRSNEKTAVRR